MSGSNRPRKYDKPEIPTARQLAAEALVRIDEDDAYANLVTPKLLAQSKLDPRDRRFVTELVYGTTRMRRAVDHLLAPHVLKPPPAIATAALRLGAYQLHYMKIDDYAVLSETVNVVPKGLRGFVNGVLRSVTRSRVVWPDRATRLSYPDWIDRWADETFGDDAERVLSAMNTPAVVARRDDGYVQDPASQLISGLLDTQEGHRVADLCAAPGGKTSALGGDVVAVELNEARIGLLVGNLDRLDSKARVVRADAVHPPLRPASFDGVLLDAPCTGLGVLRRRPDARWRVQRRDMDRLGALQTEMLASAAALVVPGGRLVYSVCTLTDPETVDVVATLGEEFVPVGLPEPWEPQSHGARLVPDIGHDGMFAAVFTRSG
ncbi:MAG: hypothetical protein IH940_04975 [Acidobacteria bacterium]|nr:hypothetical protein [Acidobacteriota bacterium]